jgi:hypothetical protein
MSRGSARIPALARALVAGVVLLACRPEGLPCVQSTEEYCAPGGCSWDPTVPPGGYTVNRTCGPYNVKVHYGPGYQGRDYYDQTTNRLVAIVAHHSWEPQVECLVGPNGRFEEPYCE